MSDADIDLVGIEIATVRAITGPGRIDAESETRQRIAFQEMSVVVGVSTSVNAGPFAGRWVAITFNVVSDDLHELIVRLALARRTMSSWRSSETTLKVMATHRPAKGPAFTLVETPTTTDISWNAIR